MPEPVTRYVEDGGRVEDDGRITFSEAQYDALAQRLTECEGALKFYAYRDNWNSQPVRGTGGCGFGPSPIELDRLGDKARAALSAAPASQGWTSVRPTKEGWYWYRDKEAHIQKCIHVYHGIRNNWWTAGWNLGDKLLSELHGQWSGPIQSPREEE